MCVGWCGSFHLLHLWRVVMKCKPNLEYHYGACASDYINTGMHDSLCCIWVVMLGCTAMLFVLPNICKRFSNMDAYLHANQKWRSQHTGERQGNVWILNATYMRNWSDSTMGKTEHHRGLPWEKTHFYMPLGLLTARCEFVYILQLHKSLRLH